MFLPQFFGIFPSCSPGGAFFEGFNTGQGPKRGLHKGIEMEASSSSSRVRPIVVDFLATLFVTFCIGVAAAVVLGACAMLMAGEASGVEPGERSPTKTDAVREGARPGDARAKAIELALTHHLVTKYASLIAIERSPARPVHPDRGAPARAVLAPAPSLRPEKID